MVEDSCYCFKQPFSFMILFSLILNTTPKVSPLNRHIFVELKLKDALRIIIIAIAMTIMFKVVLRLLELCNLLRI